MSDRPLVFSLLVALIVVLVIGVVSLSVQVNRQSESFKKEIAKNISLQKEIEAMQNEKSRLTKDIEALTSDAAGLNTKISKLTADLEALKLDKEKTEMLKEKLEENLKDELYKKDPAAVSANKISGEAQEASQVK